MDKEILLSLGRVVYINFGPMSGKIAVVVDIVNGSRVIIDGPGLGVERQMISNRRLTLTRFRLPGVAKAEKQTALKFDNKTEDRRLQAGREVQLHRTGQADPEAEAQSRADRLRKI